MHIKFRIPIILLGAILVLSLVACDLSVDNDAGMEIPTERLVAVNTMPVQTGDIRTELSFTGIVRASTQIPVMARLSGMVSEVMFNVGDFVYAGDVLFTLDEADLQTNIRALSAQLDTANAAVNAAQTGVSLAGGSAVQGQILQAETAMIHAQAGVEQAQLGVEQAQLGVEQRQLAVSQAELAYQDASTNLQNMALLLEYGDIPQTQFDQAESGVSNTRIMLEQARSALEMAEISLEQARGGVAQAQSGVTQATASYNLVSQHVRSENLRRAQDGLAQAQAQRDALAVNLEAAEERLNDASITAPISGVISSRGVEPHAMMLPNLAPFTIVSIDTVLIHVNVTESIVNRIENGQEISVNISAASNIPFTGHVLTVSPTADPMTQTFNVEIELDNSDGLLRPGMFAEAFFTRDESSDTIVVPRSAVLLYEGQPIVFLANGEHAVQRAVTTGIDSGSEIEILEGLALGDNLIVRGQTFVRDGSPIHIVEEGVN